LALSFFESDNARRVRHVLEPYLRRAHCCEAREETRHYGTESGIAQRQLNESICQTARRKAAARAPATTLVLHPPVDDVCSKGQCQRYSSDDDKHPWAGEQVSIDPGHGPAAISSNVPETGNTPTDLERRVLE